MAWTFWIGAALGSGASLLLLNNRFLPATVSWRAAFFLGALIGVVVLFMRRHVPESPRWLMTHDREQEAQEVVSDIEEKATQGHANELPPASKTIKLVSRKTTHSAKYGMRWRINIGSDPCSGLRSW